MRLTSHDTLGRWLITVLGEQGGRSSKSAALKRMEEKYGHLLTEDDWLPQPSNKEVKWQNQTAWQRNRLVKSGVLEPVESAGFGVWALTELGWRLYRSERRN